MIRIAFDLRRTTFIASNENRDGCTQQWRRSGKEERLSWNLIFRLLDVRNDLLCWLKDATTQASQRERSAHQLDERATLDRIVPTFGLLRKLTRYEFAKHRRVSQFLETAPILLTAARRLIVLRSKNVIAHQLEIYVAVAFVHFYSTDYADFTDDKWNSFPGCVVPECDIALSVESPHSVQRLF